MTAIALRLRESPREGRDAKDILIVFRAFSRRLDADRAASALLAGIQGGVAIMLATGDLSYLEAALAGHRHSIRATRRLSGGQDGPVIADLQQGDALPHPAQHADDGC